ncbi:hypothetical protein GMMP15_90027 [Candidatus Magnetomoraceae bacterium gMMP-15]
MMNNEEVKQIKTYVKSVGKTEKRNDDFVYALNISNTRAIGVLGDFTSDSRRDLNKQCLTAVKYFIEEELPKWKFNLTPGPEIIKDVANYINKWLKDSGTTYDRTTLIVILYDSYENKLYYTIKGDSGLAIIEKNSFEYIYQGDTSGIRNAAGFLPITDEFNVETKEISSSDIIFAYTDGLWENTNFADNDNQLKEIFRKNTLNEIKEEIDNKIFKRSYRKDDLSILILKEEKTSKIYEESVYDERPSQKTEQLYKINEKDRETIQEVCNKLEKDYKLYSLLGFSGSGKSSFIYSLEKKFGKLKRYNYTRQGNQWDVIEKHMIEGTPRGLYIYPVINNLSKDNIALLDIAGEQFFEIKDCHEEMRKFFGMYFHRCSGHFIFIDMTRGLEKDKNILNKNLLSDSGEQLKQIISFLSVAPIDELNKNISDIGSKKLKVPVTLCLSKADEIEDYDFDYGDISGTQIPQKFNAWDLVSQIWPGHFESLINLVPELKIEWLSSLGRGFKRGEFKETRKIGKPIGIESIFDFVVANPLPSWAMSSKRYLKFKKLFQIKGLESINLKKLS